MQGDVPRSGGAAIRRENRLDRLTRVDRVESRRVEEGGSSGQPANAVRRRRAGQESWAVGDRIHHHSFGAGQITHLFGSGEKISIAVRFEGMPPKILDPRLAPITRLAN